MLGQYTTKALYEFPKPTIAAINGPALLVPIIPSFLSALLRVS
jgi:hypothetical protein